MKYARVGEFEVEVSDPYPCRVSIKDSRGNELCFPHTALPDLRYAVDRAIRAARDELRRDGRADKVEEAGDPHS